MAVRDRRPGRHRLALQHERPIARPEREADDGPFDA
jgi:hypothetical protein